MQSATGETRNRGFFKLVLPVADFHAHPAASSVQGKAHLMADALSERTKRRVWMFCPAGEVELAFDEVTLTPVATHETPRRWLDFGHATLPASSHINIEVRASGASAEALQQSWLFVSDDPEEDLAGLTLEQAQARVLGIAPADAGSTTIAPARVPVGAPTTYRVHYAAGPKGLSAGHLVGLLVPIAFDAPQDEDPDRPGYTRLHSGGNRVRIAEMRPFTEPHYRVIVLEVVESLGPGEGFALDYRSDTTYIFDRVWRSEQSAGFAPLYAPLSACVSTGVWDRWAFVPPERSHTIAYVPGPPERVHLILPGRRRVGEALTLHGVITDRYRNLPQAGRTMPGDMEIVLEDQAGERVQSLSPQMTSTCRFRAALPALEPGVYRARARQSDGTVLARSNPLQILGAEDERLPIYWGNLHNHSEMSDGCDPFEQIYAHSRDVAALDFAAATDHLGRMTDNSWRTMQQITNRWHEPGRFCTLVGHEFISTCFYTSRDELAAPAASEGGGHARGVSLAQYSETLAEDPTVVAGVHGHANAINARVIDACDERVCRFLQIYGTFGRHEFPGNPLDGLEPHHNGAYVLDELNKGRAVGITAGGDIHCARPGFSSQDPEGQGLTPHDLYGTHAYQDGLTAAFMPALERQPLIDALRAGRIYGTTGARILLELSLGEIAMGETGAAERVAGRLEVHGAHTLERIEILRDGAVIWSLDADRLDEERAWEDPSVSPGPHWYLLRVSQTDGELAWSSPIWCEVGGAAS